jgi:hypothetical protein
MPRSMQITVPPAHTEKLVAEIQKLDGLIGLRLQRGVSIQPSGDIVSLEVTTPALHEIMRVLDRLGIGADANSSAVTNYPLAIVTASQAEAVAADSSDATWEEIELTIGRESNMTVNGLLQRQSRL